MDFERDDDREPVTLGLGLGLGLALAASGAALLVFAYYMLMTIGQLVSVL